jgi:glycerate 2-kinase
MREDPKKTAEEIFRAALEAADPYRAVEDNARRIRDAYEKGGFKRLVVAGFGKASVPMVEAIEDTLGDIVAEGVAITKHGALKGVSPGLLRGRVRLCEAGHPVPDKHGLRAASELARLLEKADEDTLVVCLISGGGSALLTAPQEGVSLEEKQELTNALLRSGADIRELNAVRKHVSRVKGGRLARMAHPAGVVSLIVSDVVGDPLDVIASGPTAPDASTYGDALAVLEKYRISAPPGVKAFLEKGSRGEIPETPKEDDPVFATVENIIVSNNRSALEQARRKAREKGFRAEVLTDTLQGDVSETARWLLEKAQETRERPAALISGGETTVVVRGPGKGGRNMHMALGFALMVENAEGITMLSAGTDGTDGPTDAAGAVVDGRTVPQARAKGIDPEACLRKNDSYTFFHKAGGLLVTGPTGTNVMDVQVILLT